MAFPPLPCTFQTGSLLGTASLDGTVRVWSAADGSLVRVCEGPAEGCEWLAWHPKGDVVLAGSEDFSMWMWLAQSGQCMQVRSRVVVLGEGKEGSSRSPGQGVCCVATCGLHPY
jgi:WD40 repeat protein